MLRLTINMLKERTRLYIFLIICGLGVAQYYEEGDFCEFAGYNGTCLATSNCLNLPSLAQALNLEHHQIGSCGFSVHEEMICCPILPVVQSAPKNFDPFKFHPSTVEGTTEGIKIGSNTQNVADNNKFNALFEEIFGKNVSNEKESETNTEGRQIDSNDNNKLNLLIEEIFGKNVSNVIENETNNAGMVPATKANEIFMQLFNKDPLLPDIFGKNVSNVKESETNTEGRQIGSHDNNKLNVLIEEIFGKNVSNVKENETNKGGMVPATNANERFMQLFNKNPRLPDIADGSVNPVPPGHAERRILNILIEGERGPVVLETTTVKPSQVPPQDLDAILNDILSNGHASANIVCETRHYKGVCKPRLQCTHLAQSLTDMRLNDKDVTLCDGEDIICCPNLERPAVRACRDIESRLSPFQGEHIFGGHKVSIMQYPHMVKIVYEQSEFLCGGTLIHHRFVLTAAHCVIVRGTKPTKVIMGVDNLTDTKSRSRQEIDIEAVYDHRQYSSFAKYFDIALIKLVKDVRFTPSVYPTCLHTDPTELTDGIELTAAGWGRTEKQSTSDHLLAVQLNKVPHAECNGSYAYTIDQHLDHGIDDTQLCALAPGKDACSGDSGGPLLLVKNATYNNYRVVGVVSFGVMCGETMPGVYTRVSAFLDFIETIVWPEALRER